jgi:hypothetical protein
LEPGQARLVLVGLAAFAVGFAVAGLLVVLRDGGTPAYWILVSAGLVGIGMVGFFAPRGAAESARPPVWSPAGLAGVAAPLGLPVRALTVPFYVLVAVGLLGNVLAPVVLRR